MNAFRGKLPKPETEHARGQAREEEKSPSSETPASPPRQREV